MLTLDSFTNLNLLTHNLWDIVTPIDGELRLTLIQNPDIPADTPDWILPLLAFGRDNPQMSVQGTLATGFTLELDSYTVQNVAAHTILPTHTSLGHFAAGEQVHLDLDAAEAPLLTYSGPHTALIDYALGHPEFHLVVIPDQPQHVQLVGVAAGAHADHGAIHLAEA